ncbi:helix-turn-helix transcriptional regulator [Aquella oligotrophica]|uniref:HTH luxR-type domain-containing protein n=1 Tax=Aquella oligotrophica TaxID=2067065 RepID=A0A2I7N6A2_9NEIS|nr:helix-turn-helix transcriptional regulator [Aquella oligotrophica]AUR51994.1 hypothetical protein CUN60_06670 [Aquella oligotrophica]
MNHNKLTDSEFLEYYCESAEIIFNNGEEQVIYIKDKDLNFHYLSQAHIRNISNNGFFVANEDNITEEMRELHKKLKQLAYEQDDKIRQELKSADFIYIDVYDRVGFVHKRPIVNPATGNFVGLLGMVKPFEMPNILSLIYKMHGVKYGIANQSAKNPQKYKISEKQLMVLFLYLNKYSNTEVAKIMTTLGFKISATTVNDHLENLKYIFEVRTKEQLIEKAIALGYNLFIPAQFLKIGSFELEDEAIIAG